MPVCLYRHSTVDTTTNLKFVGLLLPNHRHQAPDLPLNTFLATIGKEEIRAAHRTQTTDVNPFRRHSRGDQLISICLKEIDASVAVASRSEQRLAFRKTFPEGVDHFCADFVTTGRGGWSNGHAHIVSTRAVFMKPGAARRARRSTPPFLANRHARRQTRPSLDRRSGWERSRRSSLPAETCGSGADQRVAIDAIAQHTGRGLRVLLVLDQADVGSVHLPATGQGPSPGKKLEKAAAILQNVLRCVFVKAGKVKRVAAARD